MMRVYSSRWHGCRYEEFLWRGHRLVVMENEKLRVGVLVSKGADIIEFRYKPEDLDFLWHAPQTVLPPGEFVPTTARAQGAFLDFYPGAWQEVFPNAGPMTTYKGADIGQHGEVALQPWDYTVVEDTPGRLVINFVVETMRTPFRLERRMILESGSPALILEEQVTNCGEESMHYAWGHHPALGSPFLEEGCVWEMPECVVNQTNYAKDLSRRFAIDCPNRYPNLKMIDGAIGRVDAILAKSARTEDVLLCHEFAAGSCAIRNPARGLRFAMQWSVKTFPYLWCWQVYGGSFGYPYFGRAYTVALEPFNSPIRSLGETLQCDEVPLLEPNQSESAYLKVEIQACG